MSSFSTRTSNTISHEYLECHVSPSTKKTATAGGDASVDSPVHGSGEQPAGNMESPGAQAAVGEGRLGSWCFSPNSFSYRGSYFKYRSERVGRF